MVGILCTFPGRFGDLLWALPTVRAISEQAGEPVDLQIGGEFASIVPLLREQPYIRFAHADPRWDASQWEAPALQSATKYDATYHLGYRRWPEHPLPLEVWTSAIAQHGALPTPDLARPWISLPPPPSDRLVSFTVGFTEAWFELKYGLYNLIMHRYSRRWTLNNGPVSVCTGGRWRVEAHHDGASWTSAAQWIKHSHVLLADCAALHVLGVALGVPVVICEPMEARWNPIFYPLGMAGAGVTVVTGNDGKPTFDARHVGDALEKYL